MSKVFYSALAASDLLDNSDYIARDKPDAAYRWVEEIEATCNLLAKNPGLGQSRETQGFGTCRSISCGNYVVFFRAFSAGVEIIRIVRGERDIDRM